MPEASPQSSSDEQSLTGPYGQVQLTRDHHGVPSITAPSSEAAWWGLGYAAAGDRLWQLEYDRRRACGRWSEAAGRTGLPADRLARRLRLDDAARRDVAVMDPETLSAFTAYARGVNSGAEARPLPPEYEATGLTFEPWEPWHSVAAFKIRHVLMGAWQYKLLRARILADEGPDAFAALDPTHGRRAWLTTPSGTRQGDEPGIEADLLEQSWHDLTAAAVELGFLSEVEAGSNAWVVAGDRTTTGAAILCNDSHRALDVPNVYWQAQVTCPEFAVTGATFPGIPGFPHFGHNAHVGWAITNAAADAQDLMVEQFRSKGGSLEVRTATGWQPAETRTERILVRGSDGEPTAESELTSVQTPNGPVVHGDPSTGRALSLRWTATDRPCSQFAVLGRMLRATSVEELIDVHEEWIDPVNNLLCADEQGNIGYLLRGALPQRRDRAAATLPLPGWAEASGWDGFVPFERMPREINPSNGYLANANNTVVDPAGPLLVTHAANDIFRIERIHELMHAHERHSPEQLHSYQNDVSSVPARWWSDYLTGLPVQKEDQPRRILAEWDGDLRQESPAPVLYAYFRRELLRHALLKVVSTATAERLLSAELPASAVLLKRWLAQLTWQIGATGRPGAPVDDDLVGVALADAWELARAQCGPDPLRWRWPEVHRLHPRHTLAHLGLASPAPISADGDHDTVQNASYGWRRGTPFHVTNTAVYRQVLNFAGEPGGSWVIPGGASADPTSVHYEDQSEQWAKGALWPMPGWLSR